MTLVRKIPAVRIYNRNHSLIFGRETSLPLVKVGWVLYFPSLFCQQGSFINKIQNSSRLKIDRRRRNTLSTKTYFHFPKYPGGENYLLHKSKRIKFEKCNHHRYGLSLRCSVSGGTPNQEETTLAVVVEKQNDHHPRASKWKFQTVFFFLSHTP
jgi:hypothetical protein